VPRLRRNAILADDGPALEKCRAARAAAGAGTTIVGSVIGGCTALLHPFTVRP
jgi:hypothetical protein